MVGTNIERQLMIQNAFQPREWGPVLQLSGTYYPHLIVQFYANMEDKKFKFERDIRSMVKGVGLCVTENTITNLLGIPNNGYRFAMVQNMVPRDYTWRVENAT